VAVGVAARAVESPGVSEPVDILPEISLHSDRQPPDTCSGGSWPARKVRGHYGEGIVHLNWFEKILSNPTVSTVVVT